MNTHHHHAAGKAVVPAQTSFPVDAVYMWVDGDDPQWRQAKETALQRHAAHERAHSAARFTDNQELRYSLRSLDRFAPWVRRVFLVTDGQCPGWLNTNTVTLVHHRDIFPPEAVYPVFNNRPIEFCLHRIAGLAEHFLSFNDDFMLGKPVNPADFFTADGRPIVWGARQSHKSAAQLRESVTEGANPHTSSLIIAHQLLYAHFGCVPPYKIKHYPRPMTITSMENLWRTFPETVAHTLQSQFRSNTDMSPFPFYSLYLLASGQGMLRRVNGMRQLLDWCLGRPAHIGASLGDANTAAKMRRIRLVKPQTFCINDADAARDADRELLRHFLDEYFPYKSQYEV